MADERDILRTALERIRTIALDHVHAPGCNEIASGISAIAIVALVDADAIALEMDRQQLDACDRGPDGSGICRLCGYPSDGGEHRYCEQREAFEASR